MKSEPSVLRDFTVDRRVWLRRYQACPSVSAFVQPLWRSCSCGASHFPPTCFTTIASALCPSLRRGSPLGYWMVIVPVLGGLLVGADGPFRFGQDSRARNSRSHRSNFATPCPGRSKSGRLETCISGDCNWIRRPLWRGRANHHVGRRCRIADRAMDACHRRRTNNPAGGRCGCGYAPPHLPPRLRQFSSRSNCYCSNGGPGAWSRSRLPAQRQAFCASTGSVPDPCSKCRRIGELTPRLSFAIGSRSFWVHWWGWYPLA